MNRRAIINNSGVNFVDKNIRDAIYKTMDKKEADECVINQIEDNVAEVDLFANGKSLAYGLAIVAKKEED
jgi:galactitol-specific phosphotransferase system IIB component